MRVFVRLFSPIIVMLAVVGSSYLLDGNAVRSVISATAAGLALVLITAAMPRSRSIGGVISTDVARRYWVALALGLAISNDISNGRVGMPADHACIAVAVAWGALWALGRGALALSRFARERILVVGSGEVATHVAEALDTQRGAVVVGFVDDDLTNQAGHHFPVLGGISDLELLISRYRVASVVFAYSAQPDHTMVQAVRRCRSLGVQVGIVSRMFQELDRRTVLRRVDSIPILTIEPTLAERHTPFLERVCDVSFALLLGIVTLPISLAISLAIVIESRGGVFYRATRVGYRGQVFSMLKFRKMRPDASGPRITVAGDQRFSRVGRFLAASKLDELPQLWNVLRGEMTLVGPRPEDPHYVALYPMEYEKILSVRPGVTGLAQIQYRDEASLLLGDDYEELYRSQLLPAKISIDRYYADRRSLRLDMRILCWTLIAIVRGARVEHHPLTDAVNFRRGEMTSSDLDEPTPPDAPVADSRAPSVGVSAGSS